MSYFPLEYRLLIASSNLRFYMLKVHNHPDGSIDLYGLALTKFASR